MEESVKYYIHYENVKGVRELISLIRAAISKNSQIVKNHTSLYHLPPKIDLIFTDTSVQIVYSKSSISSYNEECKDFSFLFDYDDFEDSQMFGRTIKQVLRSGILATRFPNIPPQDLDFVYDFGEDTLKVSICNPLPF
jgi:hypothetical protein